ncbi:TPA: hypothetical protein ACNUX9_001999 [Providencia rettgeri]
MDKKMNLASKDFSTSLLSGEGKMITKNISELKHYYHYSVLKKIGCIAMN